MLLLGRTSLHCCLPLGQDGKTSSSHSWKQERKFLLETLKLDLPYFLHPNPAMQILCLSC